MRTVEPLLSDLLLSDCLILFTHFHSSKYIFPNCLLLKLHLQNLSPIQILKLLLWYKSEFPIKQICHLKNRTYNNQVVQCVIFRVSKEDLNCPQSEPIAARTFLDHNGWLEMAGKWGELS